MHDYHGLIVPLLDQMLQRPEESQGFFRELIEEFGDPEAGAFWDSIAETGRSRIPHPDSLQSGIAAFETASTLRDRWSIAVAAIGLSSDAPLKWVFSEEVPLPTWLGTLIARQLSSGLEEPGSRLTTIISRDVESFVLERQP